MSKKKLMLYMGGFISNLLNCRGIWEYGNGEECEECEECENGEEYENGEECEANGKFNNEESILKYFKT